MGKNFYPQHTDKYGQTKKQDNSHIKQLANL